MQIESDNKGYEFWNLIAIIDIQIQFITYASLDEINIKHTVQKHSSKLK